MTSQNFKVDFFGISPPRCATSWMYINLKAHPGICMSSYKETAFFGKYRYNQGFKFYSSCFKECKPGQLKGDSTPTYFSQDNVVQRIKHHNPEAKIYLCLRNPIERSFSHYLHHHSQGLRASLLTFEQALEEMPEHYLRPSLYYSCLKEFLAAFPRNNILILIYDDLVKNPLGFIQQIYNFLGVDDNFVPLDYNKKLNPLKRREFKRKSLFKVIFKFDYFLRKNRILAPVYNPVRPKAMRSWHNLRKHYLKDAREEVVQGRPSLSIETKQKLKKVFNPEIEKIEEIIGRDLSQWKTI